jgi:predicted transcriptional regulator
MNINVYIEDKLAGQLSEYAEKFHRKKNSIVREAIRDWLTRHTERKWSDAILQFKGIEEFPDIKELRKGILKPTN